MTKQWNINLQLPSVQTYQSVTAHVPMIETHISKATDLKFQVDQTMVSELIMSFIFPWACTVLYYQ